jgi:hypothetical protein
MQQLGPERLMMMGALPTTYDRDIDRYVRWEYPNEEAPGTLWRLLATGGASDDRPARESILVRLSRFLTGRTGAGVRVGQAVSR